MLLDNRPNRARPHLKCRRYSDVNDSVIVTTPAKVMVDRVAESAGAIVLRLALNLGVGGALRAGFRFAVDHHYVAVVQVDADGQQPASQIRDLIAAAEQHHAHLVIGSRYLSPDTKLIPTASRRFAM